MASKRTELHFVSSKGNCQISGAFGRVQPGLVP